MKHSFSLFFMTLFSPMVCSSEKLIDLSKHLSQENFGQNNLIQENLVQGSLVQGKIPIATVQDQELRKRKFEEAFKKKYFLSGILFSSLSYLKKIPFFNRIITNVSFLNRFLLTIERYFSYVQEENDITKGAEVIEENNQWLEQEDQATIADIKESIDAEHSSVRPLEAELERKIKDNEDIITKNEADFLKRSTDLVVLRELRDKITATNFYKAMGDDFFSSKSPFPPSANPFFERDEKVVQTINELISIDIHSIATVEEMEKTIKHYEKQWDKLPIVGIPGEIGIINTERFLNVIEKNRTEIAMLQNMVPKSNSNENNNGDK